MNKTPIDNDEEPFDYEYLGYCDYPVADPRSPSGETECREFAVARGWWDNYDNAWLLCQEHLDFILETEEQEAS